MVYSVSAVVYIFEQKGRAFIRGKRLKKNAFIQKFNFVQTLYY